MPTVRRAAPSRPGLRAAAALLALLVGSAAMAAGPEPLVGGAWPRRWAVGHLTLSLFQPEVQRWDGAVLSLRAAAQVQKGVRQAYGLVHLEALTEVDRARGVVRLTGVRVTRAEFPTVPQKELHWKGLFGARVADRWALPLDQLEADAALAESEARAEGARDAAAPAPPAPMPTPPPAAPPPRQGQRD